MKQTVKNMIRAMVPTAYRLGRIFAKKDRVPDLDEALGMLHRHHPDPGGSCIWDNPLPPPRWDLTVIIPVYNVERYLAQCLDSVLEQDTRCSFRVIAVEDGSTDSSPRILEGYRGHPRLTIVHQKNAGVSAARNAALLGLESRYVMFVDSDDLLEPGAIQAMMDAAEAGGADVIQGGYLCFRDEDGSTVYDRRFPDGPCGGDRVTGLPWGKLLRSRLFERVCFPLGYWYEDTVIWLVALPLARRVETVSRRVYRYRRHGASITGSDRGKPKTVDTCYVTLSVLAAREALGLEQDGALCRKLLNQAAINCKRTLAEPEWVQRCVFAVSHHLLRPFPGGTEGLNKWETGLEQALREGNFSGYRLLCRAWPQ